MKKVVKFGGSSLASAEQFKKVGAIISADESRVYVVPSAPGKRFPEDTKVTDMLLHVYETAKAGEDITEEMKAIKKMLVKTVYLRFEIHIQHKRVISRLKRSGLATTWQQMIIVQSQSRFIRMVLQQQRL